MYIFTLFNLYLFNLISDKIKDYNLKSGNLDLAADSKDLVNVIKPNLGYLGVYYPSRNEMNKSIIKLDFNNVENVSNIVKGCSLNGGIVRDYAGSVKRLSVAQSRYRRCFSSSSCFYVSKTNTLLLRHNMSCYNLHECYPVFLKDLEIYLESKGIDTLSIDNIVCSFRSVFLAIVSLNDYVRVINNVLPYIKPEFVSSYILPAYDMSRKNAIVLLQRIGFKNVSDLILDIDKSFQFNPDLIKSNKLFSRLCSELKVDSLDGLSRNSVL